MKKILLLMLAIVVSLSFTGVAMAANPPNLIGTWSGTVHFVIWNNISSQFSYTDLVFTYEIQDQDPDTGNFYGLDNSLPPFPFTGNVATNKIVTIIEYFTAGEFRIFTGKVTGKKISGTVQHFHPDQIDTGTFILYKQQVPTLDGSTE